MENQKDELFIDTASSGRHCSIQTFSQEKIIKNHIQACLRRKHNHVIGHLPKNPQTYKNNYRHSWANWSKCYPPIKWKSKYLWMNVEIRMQGGSEDLHKLNKRIAEYNIL